MFHPDTDKLFELQRLIEKASNIVIVSHVNPDGDAVGSSTGMLSYLLSKGKDARILLPGPVADTLAFIQDEQCRLRTSFFSDDPEAARRLTESCDLLVCQDFNTLTRLDDLGDILAEAKCPKVLIDHHPNPQEDAFDVVFSKTDLSSACEHVYWILRSLEGGSISGIPGEGRYALMCGMTTDTNNFANSTFPSTLEMASELIASGVDRDDIIEHVYNSYREERLRAMSYVLQNMEITPDGVAILTLSAQETENLGLRDGESEGFVNLPLALAKVRMSIFIREKDDAIRVSLRSKRGTSSNAVAGQYFHGGGHVLASGGKILVPEDVADFGEVRDYARRMTAEYFKNN